LYWIDIAMPWPAKDDDMPVHEIEKKLAA